MLTGAVIGCGHGGRLSIEAMCASQFFDCVAVVDTSKTAIREVKHRHPNVRLFGDFREMLETHRPDVVAVATPVASHASIGLACLQHAPKGLLLEKPLASDFDLADSLLRRLKAERIPLVVPHGMLVLPVPQAVRELIRSGEIGEIIHVEIQNAVDLLNGGIHWLVFLLDTFREDRPVSSRSEFDISETIVNDGMVVERRGVTRVSLESGLNWVLHSGKDTQPTSKFIDQEYQKGAVFRIEGEAGAVEFCAWADGYWIENGTDAWPKFRSFPPMNASYHQIFLDKLAESIARGDSDYHSADLSLAALGLIENAYRDFQGGETRLGTVVGDPEIAGGLNG